jgi:LMBR1 domain-containing protein 1
MNSNFWIYTDLDGNICKLETYSDSDVILKLQSSNADENELIAVCKTPISSFIEDKELIEKNDLKLLNQDELEKYLFSKKSEVFVIQKFVKCRGPKAFVCRTVWRRNKPPYVYILTNKANYMDIVLKQELKYSVNSEFKDTYFPFYATSGKHLEETIVFMNSIVKFIEGHSDIQFDELIGDFIKYIYIFN